MSDMLFNLCVLRWRRGPLVWRVRIGWYRPGAVRSWRYRVGPLAMTVFALEVDR